MKMYNTLLFEQDGSIALIKINRPNALNALNSDVFNDLNEVLDYIENLQELRVLIITGVGKAFVAGADIAEMSNKTPLEATLFSERGQATFNRIENLKMPVIAAINGFALGGGLELAMAADFRIASDKAKMGQPEVNLGLIPGFAGTQRLSRLVGLADALFLLTTTQVIDAQEAFRIKLVQRVFPHETLMEETLKIANNILSKAPKAIEKVKQVTVQGFYMNMDDAQKLEADMFGSCFDAEGKEGMSAFLEKRKPNF
jgi:enoyl-CoA hydratase